MHNPESILENESLKHLWDFEIQTDHLISTKQTDLIIIKKKKKRKKRNFWIVDSDHSVKLKEIEKKGN